MRIHSSLRSGRYLGLCLAFSMTSASAAQWSTDTSTNQVVSNAASGQNQAKVKASRDGGYWVSWLDGIGTGWDVRLQRYDIEGNAIFPAGGLLVADRSFSSTQDYGLAVAENGDALLAFRDDRSGNVEITAARYAPNGAPRFGAAGSTLTSGNGFVASPRIVEAGGSVVVGWTQNANVRVRVLDANGIPTTSDRSWGPSAGSYLLSDMQSGGGDAIFSVVHATGGFSSPRHLLIQKLQPNGFLPWGIPLTPVYTAGSLQIGAFPSFTAGSDGASFLTWYSSSPSLECFAQWIDTDGSARWAPNGVTVSATPGVRVSPVLASTDGALLPVVAWQEQNLTQSQSGISAQRLDPATGQRLWGADGITVSPVSSQLGLFPSVTVDAPTQTTTIRWVEMMSFGNDQIFGQVVDAAGQALAPTFELASTPSTKSRLTAAKGSFGGSLAVWADNRSDSGDILAQQLSDDGAPGTLGIISTQSPTCTVIPNSLGFRSTAFVLGSPSAQANDNVLWAVGLPSQSFGYFITSQTPGFSPGQTGNLCLGGSIGRFTGPGQIASSGSAGTLQVAIDLTQQPTPTGLVTVQAGEQWYYQAWHRDLAPNGPISNFSGACSVLYQ